MEGWPNYRAKRTLKLGFHDMRIYGRGAVLYRARTDFVLTRFLTATARPSSRRGRTRWQGMLGTNRHR